MPQIKFKHVVSFSSEDRNHPADNLLKDDYYRKWKCAQTGDKSAFVVLQFEKAQEIHAIDIGNESSAFIEVLVNRSESKEDYQVLLVTSSFMSPTESKSASNLNRVRMFTKDKFTPNVAKEKWDLVKIVCTQPFNKALQFGLSFIKIHSTPDENENVLPNKPQNSLRLGAFKIKDDDETSKDLKPGSLFANRKDKSESQALTAAAAIREASKKAEESLKKGQKPSSVIKPVTVFKPSSVSKPTKNVSLKAAAETKKLNTISPTLKKADTSKALSRTPLKKDKKSDEPSRKRQKTEVNSSSSKRNCPFERIMSGVVFALSGFQNPYRSELREKGLEMGAKYRPDWDSSCTHLICAFANTPKFIQVQGKGGKIVSKDWIIDCYTKKKKLSQRLYKMSDSGYADDTSEDDVTDVGTSSKNAKQDSSTGNGSVTSISPTGDMKEDEENASLINSVASDTQPLSSDECDTEDEINRLNEKECGDAESDEAYNADTDVEDDSENKTENGFFVSDLPDYFCGLHFFLYGDFDPAMRRLIIRYIVAFKGFIEDNMNDKVKYVVTQKDWNDNFDEALKENSKLTFVKPTWIFACRDKGKLVSHQQHIVEAV